MGNIYRGSWEPISDGTRVVTFRCPFCSALVQMGAGIATYPTCPFCLSDMPEAEDFETPEEFEQRIRGNRSCTGHTWSEDISDAEKKRQRSREYYLANRERVNEKARKRHRMNRDEENRKARERYHNDPEVRRRKLEWQKKYHEAHKEQINAKARADRAANPEKYKVYQERSRGKPMREVEAHIKGVPVEEIPEPDFYFGKGVRR